jgi:hypothetical protein
MYAVTPIFEPGICRWSGFVETNGSNPAGVDGTITVQPGAGFPAFRCTKLSSA